MLLAVLHGIGHESREDLFKTEIVPSRRNRPNVVSALLDMAQARWRRLDGAHRLTLVRALSPSLMVRDGSAMKLLVEIGATAVMISLVGAVVTKPDNELNRLLNDLQLRVHLRAAGGGREQLFLHSQRRIQRALRMVLVGDRRPQHRRGLRYADRDYWRPRYAGQPR